MRHHEAGKSQNPTAIFLSKMRVLLDVLSVPGLREDVVINVVLAKYFRSINVGIGRCTAVGNMSIWTSCFPPLDKQRFLGDTHKCHVFYINAVNIIVWVTFTSDCVSPWERILFKCWHLKMKIG